MAQCKAKTKSGYRCQNSAQEGSDYCHVPSHNETGEGEAFSLGNSGKPKRWTTPEALQEDIDAYFEWCKENPIEVYHSSKIDDNTGKPLKYPIDRPYTIEGLCEFLGCVRDTLIHYEKEEGYEEYFDTIKRAKNKIQRNKVERALTGEAPASTSIFDLKNNHGYKDKSEVRNVNENTHEFLDDLFPEVKD